MTKISLLALVALATNAFAGDKLPCTDFSGHYHIGPIASACSKEVSTSNPRLLPKTQGEDMTITLTPGFIGNSGVALRDDVTLKQGTEMTIVQRDCESFTITYEVPTTGLDKPLILTRKVPFTGQADHVAWTPSGLTANGESEHHVKYAGGITGKSHLVANWTLSRDTGGDMIMSTSTIWSGHIGKDAGAVVRSQSCLISKIDPIAEALKTLGTVSGSYDVNPQPPTLAEDPAAKLIQSAGTSRDFAIMQAELLRQHGFKSPYVMQVK